MSDSLRPHGPQHANLPCPSPTPRGYSVLRLIESVMSEHPSISSSVIPFSYLQSFPASGSFQMSQFFTSGAQSIGASTSASVLPMNIVFSLTSPEMMRWSRIDIFIVLWGVLYSTDFRVKSARFESC